MEKDYLAIYDIAGGKRLHRVAAILEDYGFRVQKSVFELRLSDAARLEMEQRLRAVIRDQEDGIKIFPLCASCQAGKQGLGAVRFPDGDPGWILL
ncbi:CRISPR-associated endonuclease Cas2 [uncultured Desulfovibrio sp.]|uniref:CRISPR-associated endonuclease Cas2 n=1 Tax=uncultured Desulfovibrio sp. TaxID=167968 RepID=UPI002621C23A|nr:CRISPR-associated endonuclease Cas2 [uncultured Desulfovibrio sp.]